MHSEMTREIFFFFPWCFVFIWSHIGTGAPEGELYKDLLAKQEPDVCKPMKTENKMSVQMCRKQSLPVVMGERMYRANIFMG